MLAFVFLCFLNLQLANGVTFVLATLSMEQPTFAACLVDFACQNCLSEANIHWAETNMYWAETFQS